MTDKILRKSDLLQFTGTDTWYRHGLMRRMLYTEGVRYVAETAEAYWLVDAIVFAQAEARVAAEAFQFWILAVEADHSAVLRCEDGNGKEVYRSSIPFTDFPLAELQFYFTENVLLLPTEY